VSSLNTNPKIQSQSEGFVLLRYLLQLRWRLAHYFAILAMTTGMEGIGLGMIIPILQAMTGQEKSNVFVIFFQRVFAIVGLEYTFPILIGVFSTIILAKYLLAGYERHLIRALSAERTYDLRCKAFKNLMDVPFRFFYRGKLGDLVSTQITSCQNVGALIEYTLFELNAILFCILYLIINCLISLPLTVFTLGLGSISYLLFAPRIVKGRVQGTEEKAILDDVSSFLFDTFSGIKLVKAFNNEKTHLQRYREKIKKYKEIVVRMMDNRILASLLAEPLLFILGVSSLVVALKVLGMSLISAIAFLFVFIQLLPKIKAIYNNHLMVNELLPHFQKVQALVDLRSSHDPSDQGTPICTLEREIRFREVSFWYPGIEKPALNHISLTIPAGKTIAIVGGSGGGKTTFLDLLLRLHDPAEGTVEVDGIDLSQYGVADWRRLIGVVEQECFLFNDSIANNIRYGQFDASIQDVERVARIANIHDVISKLPQGYEANVGNRGMNLSGGQKQRLSLARALLRDPKIIILDEATSALDSESETLIQNSMAPFCGEKTIIMVSHRLSTVRNADYIYILEKGELIEQGTHESLIELSGRYSELYVYQHREEK